jgi:hypothetical protein
MRNKWLIIAVLFPALSFCQGNASKMHTIVSVGVAAGESTAKPLGQVSAGYTYNRFFTGLGLGVDQYRFKSIPLFADWRMNIGKSRSVFVFANGGYNFSYGKEPGDLNSFKTSDRYSGGVYFDAGMGYRLRLSAAHRLSLSAGYSQKNIVNEVGYPYPCFNPPCSEEVYRYHYNLGRVTGKLSWEFGR